MVTLACSENLSSLSGGAWTELCRESVVVVDCFVVVVGRRVDRALRGDGEHGEDAERDASGHRLEVDPERDPGQQDDEQAGQERRQDVGAETALEVQVGAQARERTCSQRQHCARVYAPCRQDYVSSCCRIPLMAVVYQVVGFGRGDGRHTGRHGRSAVK